MIKKSGYAKVILVESVLIIVLSLMLWRLWDENRNMQENLLNTSVVTPTAVPQEEFETENIAQIAMECFQNYQNMCFDYFMTFPVSADSDSVEATINGESGYYLVEEYNTIQEVKDHIETICTREYTEELCRREWMLDSDYPFLAEAEGRLYALLADAPYDSGTVEIPLVVLEESGCIVFAYKITHDDDSEWTEEGTVVLEEQDGKWLVDSVTKWE